ncbi:hypothetical protein E2C01_097503 [Portunus trituberculatus]|uniref:Uncharacterized protein n=1 Tax=Portunus trituberculatus TaxID=210409 RepID=A0A5B7JVC7_PORTR|nr:hypothetical protein [Portunus trituberculatus]
MHHHGTLTIMQPRPP